MGFYKTTQKAALDAWDNEIHQRAELKEKALEFAKKFGGKPVFCGDATDFRFHGLSFDAAPLIGHSSLWTLSRSQNGYTREPRGKSRIPREPARNICSCWTHGMRGVPQKEFQGSLTGKRWALNGGC